MCRLVGLPGLLMPCSGTEMKPVGRGGEPPFGNTAGEGGHGKGRREVARRKASRHYAHDTEGTAWQLMEPGRGWARKPAGAGAERVAHAPEGINAGIGSIAQAAAA